MWGLRSDRTNDEPVKESIRKRLIHLFTPTILLGAFLLFQLELTIGKELLPV